jgi:hypothetical protein
VTVIHDFVTRRAAQLDNGKKATPKARKKAAEEAVQLLSRPKK